MITKAYLEFSKAVHKKNGKLIFPIFNHLLRLPKKVSTRRFLKARDFVISSVNETFWSISINQDIKEKSTSLDFLGLVSASFSHIPRPLLGFISVSLVSKKRDFVFTHMIYPVCMTDHFLERLCERKFLKNKEEVHESLVELLGSAMLFLWVSSHLFIEEKRWFPEQAFPTKGGLVLGVIDGKSGVMQIIKRHLKSPLKIGPKEVDPVYSHSVFLKTYIDGVDFTEKQKDWVEWYDKVVLADKEKTDEMKIKFLNLWQTKGVYKENLKELVFDEKYRKVTLKLRSVFEKYSKF